MCEPIDNSKKAIADRNKMMWQLHEVEYAQLLKKMDKEKKL